MNRISADRHAAKKAADTIADSRARLTAAAARFPGGLRKSTNATVSFDGAFASTRSRTADLLRDVAGGVRGSAGAVLHATDDLLAADAHAAEELDTLLHAL
jgi:hypothetical protein